jgi:hypothetical protein
MSSFHGARLGWIPVLFATSLFATMSCAGSAKPAATGEEPAGLDADSGSAQNTANEDGPDAAPSSTQAAGPVEHELSHGDCQALGGKYRDLTTSDQLAKLDPKVTQAQREQARSAVEKAAVIVADKWTASCEESLVGKFTDESWLTCAMGSKTVAAFDQCLNGGPPK